MLFFKRRPKVTEQRIRELVQEIENSYTAKEIDSLTKLFHPDNRQISFLNHFNLMLTFQIYHIDSTLLDLKILELTDQEATFTYTRKHLYKCLNENDGNGDNPNNISSYYVKVSVDNKQLWISRFSRYSELFLDLDGNVRPNEQAVVPPQAIFFDKIRRFLHPFQLGALIPASYFLYNDSESIGYYPATERFSYFTSEKFTIDYFEEMAADSITEHTDILLNENELEYGQIIEVKDEAYSIIEIKCQGNSGLIHELILSMTAPDGFFMIRYMKSDGSEIDADAKQSWFEQMKAATKYIDTKE
ncbi:hypothetical protein [Metabacillus malikii]|uniref:Uncharacterized protein n=1 Tax=Metabacillus malikii TaxID=1504265 RepID=A0ABT9ZMG4_9BACI|nr:hypothetical protein [Metabacillus malikii]MDQ0233444.1 hypothetical protein [Metabacillus malikii]